jgi:hypothetical protein
MGFMLAWTIIFLISGFHFIYMQYFATDHRSDERDRDIRLRSSRSSYQVLMGGIFVFAIFYEFGWVELVQSWRISTHYLCWRTLRAHSDSWSFTALRTVISATTSNGG